MYNKSHNLYSGSLNFPKSARVSYSVDFFVTGAWSSLKFATYSALRNMDFPENEDLWMYKAFQGYADVKVKEQEAEAEVKAEADIDEEDMMEVM